jgi:hypothetical protein
MKRERDSYQVRERSVRKGLGRRVLRNREIGAETPSELYLGSASHFSSLPLTVSFPERISKPPTERGGTGGAVVARHATNSLSEGETVTASTWPSANHNLPLNQHSTDIEFSESSSCAFHSITLSPFAPWTHAYVPASSVIRVKTCINGVQTFFLRALWHFCLPFGRVVCSFYCTGLQKSTSCKPNHTEQT